MYNSIHYYINRFMEDLLQFTMQIFGITFMLGLCVLVVLGLCYIDKKMKGK